MSKTRVAVLPDIELHVMSFLLFPTQFKGVDSSKVIMFLSITEYETFQIDLD